MMNQNGKMTRREACYVLGVGENVSEEQIKRAYRYKAKLYHPDANPDADTKEYYIKVQDAYECLMNNPSTTTQTMRAASNVNAQTARSGAGGNWQYNSPFHHSFVSNPMGAASYTANTASVRPAKVYASTASAKASYKKQKDKEREREKLQKWDEEYKSNKKRQQQTQLYGKEYTDKMTGTSKSKEEEVLEKIRAIWLAETIKQQIELDKEHKEVLQRRKLYQAFMQQNMQEDDARNK